MTKKYFGTDGIRGKVNSKHINGDMFFKFGLASGTYFKSQKKKETNSYKCKRYKIIWLHTRACVSFGVNFSWNARLYFGSTSN